MAINPILSAIQQFARHIYNATGVNGVSRIELEPNVYNRLADNLRYSATSLPPPGARVVNTRDTTGIITLATDCGEVQVVKKQVPSSVPLEVPSPSAAQAQRRETTGARGATATVTGIDLNARAVTFDVAVPNDFQDLAEHLRRNGEASMARMQREQPIGHAEWDALVGASRDPGFYGINRVVSETRLAGQRYGGGEADRLRAQLAALDMENYRPEPPLAHPAGSGAIFSGAPTSEAPRGIPRRR